MTPRTAKALTLEKCLFRQVHLDGSRCDVPVQVQDFEMYEFTITSTPIVAKVKKLKVRYDGPAS
jgi:hypothetical protein